MTAIRFGQTSVLEFDLSTAPHVVAIDVPRGQPIVDLRAAVATAISHPLDFPPLALATTPGDKVVLALDEWTPCSARITDAIIDALLAQGVEAEDITILRTGTANPSGGVPADELPANISGRGVLSIHDPTNAEQHCHLENRANGDEIRIHRQLFLADVIIPIGVLRGAMAWDYFGVHSTLFPAFADAASQNAFRQSFKAGRPGSKKGRKPTRASPSPRERRVAFVNEVAWELGVAFTVQVVPGPGDSVLHVLAGDAKSVARQGERLRQVAWRFQASAPAELVVLGLGGPQTWENLTSAIIAAAPLVAPHGSLAVCTELATPPGVALRSLANRDDLSTSLRRMKRKNVPDASLALQLARVMESVKIYLLSRLDEDAVEDLGIAHVSDPADVVRLARRAESCLIVPEAQFAEGKCERVEREMGEEE